MKESLKIIAVVVGIPAVVTALIMVIIMLFRNEREPARTPCEQFSRDLWADQYYESYTQCCVNEYKGGVTCVPLYELRPVRP